MAKEWKKASCFVNPAGFEKDSMNKLMKRVSSGIDLRLVNNGHMSCPQCESNKFNIIKCDSVVCVGCAKCSWECYVYTDRYGVAVQGEVDHEEEYINGQPVPVTFTEEKKVKLN